MTEDIFSFHNQEVGATGRGQDWSVKIGYRAHERLWFSFISDANNENIIIAWRFSVQKQVNSIRKWLCLPLGWMLLWEDLLNSADFQWCEGKLLLWIDCLHSHCWEKGLWYRVWYSPMYISNEINLYQLFLYLLSREESTTSNYH